MRVQFIYHKIRNLYPIWSYLNRESRAYWRRHGGNPLNRYESELVKDLRRHGIATLPMTALSHNGTLEEMQEFARVRSQELAHEFKMKREMIATRDTHKKQGGKYIKDFWVDLWARDINGLAVIDIENPFIKFLLSDTILRIASAYIGTAARLNGVSLTETIPVSADTDPYLSQRWHRDPEDKRMLKVFIYLNDVLDVGTGPFTYVMGSHYGGPYSGVFPQRPPVGRYPDMGAVEKAVPRHMIKTCLAPAGTIIFADTAGLHRGGFSTTGSRVMFSPSFTSDASVHPIRYNQPEKSVPLLALAKYALRS